MLPENVTGLDRGSIIFAMDRRVTAIARRKRANALMAPAGATARAPLPSAATSAGTSWSRPTNRAGRPARTPTAPEPTVSRPYFSRGIARQRRLRNSIGVLRHRGPATRPVRPASSRAGGLRCRFMLLCTNCAGDVARVPRKSRLWLALLHARALAYLTSSASPLAISAPATVRRKATSLMPWWKRLPMKMPTSHRRKQDRGDDQHLAVEFADRPVADAAHQRRASAGSRSWWRGSGPWRAGWRRNRSRRTCCPWCRPRCRSCRRRSRRGARRPAAADGPPARAERAHSE